LDVPQDAVEAIKEKKRGETTRAFQHEMRKLEMVADAKKK